MLMDCNEPFGGPLDKALAQYGLDLEEFTHHYWVDNEPRTHIDGSKAICSGGIR